jgi:hypothetical protein
VASRRVPRDGDLVVGKIAAYGADARTELGREVLDTDALHDVALPQILLETVKPQAAGPTLATFAKRTGTLSSELPTVLNERPLTLHPHPTLRRDLARTRLQRPGTSKRRAPRHPGPEALIGRDPLTQLPGTQPRYRWDRQRQAWIEVGQRAILVGGHVVAAQMPRRQRAKPAATQMTLHPVLVSVIPQHARRRIQPLAADEVGLLHVTRHYAPASRPDARGWPRSGGAMPAA